MGVNSGPQIARSGLVAMYDMANTKSFRGLTATNLIYTISPYVMTQNAYFKSASGTESAFIPYFNQSVTVLYQDVYNDYNGGSGHCCPQLFNYHSPNVSVSGSTTYTYQIIFKTDTGYYSTNYMYRYEFSAAGATLTEGGSVDVSRMEQLGDGWIHAWGQFTTNASTVSLSLWCFHYEYATWNRVRIHSVSLTQGTTVHRPEHFLAARATRGTTVATGGGLVDLVGGNSGELLNGVGYNSTGGGSLTFDGVDDYVDGPIVAPNAGNFSVRIVAKWSTLSDVFAAGTGTGLSGGTYIQCTINTSGLIVSLYTNTWNYGTTVPNVAGTFATNTIYDITVVNSGTLWTFYKDGQFLANYTHSISTPNFSTRFGMFRNHVQIVGNAGNVHLFQVYNRVLTDAEVLTNYNAFKIRLGRSTNRNTVVIRPNLTTTGGGLYNSVSLFLDPANGSSYTRGSHRWQDLSSNRRVVTFYNAGGTTHTANPPGPPAFSQDGRGSLVFDGSNDFGKLDTVITLSTSHTVSVWVRTTSSSEGGIFTHCNGGPVYLGFSVQAKMKYWYYDLTANVWRTTLGNTNINDGTWKNLVWVKTGTNIKMYVNAVLDADSTLLYDINICGNCSTVKAIGTLWGACQSETAGAGTDSYSSMFNGSMGPLLVWGRVLSATEVSQLYDAFRPRFSNQVVVTSGLALHLSAFNRASYPGSGTTWTDLSGNGRNGTLTNGPTFNSDSGGSIVFDRVDDQVVIGDVDPLGGQSAGTWELWLRPDVYSDSPSTWRSGITTWNDPSSGLGHTWVLDLRYRSYYLAFRTTEPDVYPEAWEGGSSANNIPDSTWSHLVATYNSTDKSVNVYINGTNVLSTTKPSGGNISAKNGNEVLKIGVDRVATAPFGGRISVARLYTRALTVSEVSQNFNAERWRFGV